MVMCVCQCIVKMLLHVVAGLSCAVACRQVAMLQSLMQSSPPESLQLMGRVQQQVLIEVQRMEKLAQLKVTQVSLKGSHFLENQEMSGILF